MEKRPTDAQVALPIPSQDSSKTDPKSIVGLFKRALQKDSVYKREKSRSMQIARSQHLLSTPIGRDFTIIAPGGVEFKIHSTMIIGGPVRLQNYLHPGGVTNPNPPTSVTFPSHMLPIFVDRLVHYMYLSAYSFDKGSMPGHRHATLVPEDSVSAQNPASEVDVIRFHVYMYAMADELDYSTLKDAAHIKLVDFVMVKNRYLGWETLKHFIAMVYGYDPYETKICRDEDHALQRLAVASAIFQETQWKEQANGQFKEAVKEYTQFLADVEVIKEQHKDLLALSMKGFKDELLPKRTKGAKGNGSAALGSRVDQGGVKKRRARKQRGNELAAAPGDDDDEDIGMDLDVML